MKKLVSVATAALLSISISQPAESAGVQYLVNQKTLSTFSASATTLTAQQKAQVKATVEANPYAEKFICTGIRYYSQPMSVNIMVRKRAKAACEYAKELNPALSTWFQNKPTKARSYAGKVLLTVKTATETVDSPDISIDSFDPEMITAMADYQVQTYLAKQPESLSEVELRQGPGVTDAEAASEIERLKDIINFWGSVYGKDSIAILYGGSDLDWAVQQLHALGNTHYDSLIKSSYAVASGNCVQSSGVDMSDGSTPYLIHCVRSEIDLRRDGQIGSHEYTHLPLNHFFNQDLGGNKSQSPAWINEGGADFFGIATTLDETGADYDYWHDKQLALLRNVVTGESNPDSLQMKNWLRTISATDLVNIYTNLEQPGQSNTGQHMYSLGYWATQVLVAVYGLDAYFEFLQSMNADQTWQETWEEVYQISLEEFYLNMLPYVHWVADTYR